MLPSPMKAFRRASSASSTGTKERSPDELHLAVLTGRTKRIKHMLRQGVHIESVNSHGQTPLFCASFGGDVEVVQLLLRLGANPNRRCGVNGATPVHGAVYRGSRRVLRLLAETGGELTLKDNLEQTPRDYALKQPSPIRRQKILQFLEILLASMTLHHGLPGHHNHTLLSHSSKTNTLSLKRDGSMANVWGSCLNESANSTLNRNSTLKPPANLHKSVACHVLDQMYVSTSLPLLSPADLKKPDSTQQAYTCGGPTVYSPHTWLGTNVTVRKPTPALCLPRIVIPKGENQNGPDEGAVKSLVSELAVLRRLRHPGFLEVMAACHITDPKPDHITLVFQHIPMGTLYHHLHVQHLDLSIGAAVDILLGLVEALLFLHAHGWYHAGISSHALHLATNRHAKLGNFEFAIEFHGKESSMKVPELLRAAWLQAWQAPETLMEQMVSTRTEIYAFAAILWEIWSGMPPWSGVEEDEITRRVGAGDILPPVGGTAPSLVTYLTEYGLKWNAHERELDLQEIHTMLRSLRLQADEDERVPSVPAWGPPSIPNTPVCGRSNQNVKAGQQSKRNSVVQGNSKENKNSEVLNRKSSLVVNDNLLRNLEVKVANENLKSKKSKKSSQRKDVNANPVKKDGIQSSTLKAQIHEPQSIRKQSEVVQQSSSSSIDVRDGVATIGAASNFGNNVVGKVEMTPSGDSGFSTPCTRTPSPTNDTITSAKINPVMITSTPVKASISSVLRVDMQPDLLPNKVNIRNFAHGQTSDYRPDILAQSPIIDAGRHYRRATMASLMPVDTESDAETCRTSSPSDDNESIYDYITNPAKRAFFSESEGSQELIPYTPERPSSASKIEKKSLRSRASSALRQCEVVRRGLSLTNISSFTSTTSVTRTTSHVSLTSNSSSSASDPGSRRPRRTVSQISITLKKLTHITDSSSSSKDELSEPQSEPPQRSRRSRSVPKSPPYLHSSSSESKRGWEENKAIKPASHQLTRHSSNCSLASNPASPTHKHQQQSWLATNTPPAKTRNIREGSQTLQHTNKNKQVPVGRRWNSVSGASGTPLGDAAVKINPRRHSEGVRPRARRNRRRQEVEVNEFEEEFFDDEFNATLFQQPHMQLSVGSSENLLDSQRLDSSVATHSMLADGTVSPVSLGCRFSPGLTSSEDEEDEAITRERRLKAIISGRSTRLGALLEDADSQEDDGKISLDKDIAKACQEISEKFDDTETVYDSDDLSGPWRVEDLKKDYEPLKSVELLRNLEKNLNAYLPTYSIASDTESSGP